MTEVLGPRSFGQLRLLERSWNSGGILVVQWLPQGKTVNSAASSHVFPINGDLQSGVYESVRSVPKDWFAASIRKLLERWLNALTSVGSMWSALKCDTITVMISQPVFQVSPNHF
jgi:hypothetical protein